MVAEVVAIAVVLTGAAGPAQRAGAMKADVDRLIDS
jgi:hypothetical protein